MTKVTVRYVQQLVDRHGHARFYLRVPGQPRITLPVTGLDDPKFTEIYEAALNGDAMPQAKRKGGKPKIEALVSGTFRALTAAYLEFIAPIKTLSAKTKYARRRHLELACKVVIKTKGGNDEFGDFPVSAVRPKHIQVLLDEKRATPDEANVRRKVLLQAFDWTLTREWGVDVNPVVATKPITTGSMGHKPWHQEHVDRFVECHPPGSKAYFALALLFYTGQRIGDIVRLGKQHISKDGSELVFTQQKNEARSQRRMTLVIMPALQEQLAMVPRDQLTFLVNSYGRPYNTDSFGTWFHKCCMEAGLEGYSAHGLRKSLLTLGSNLRLSSQELAAIAGHATVQEMEKYVRERDTQMLAREGGKKIAAALVKSDPLKAGSK